MEEAEWLRSTTPTHLLAGVRDRLSERKLRLFACAACRRLWPFLRDERSRRAVEVAERYADGLASAAELAAAAALAGLALRDFPAGRFGANAAQLAVRTAESAWPAAERAAASAADADLLRDVCGNPFRPATLDPDWLVYHDGIVLRLARAIYDERLFQDLPILGDALEEAGCEDAALLAHCREPGLHARGCAVVDAILGKT
jgi:hypothetical protein